jgi:hypothetical protein
VDLDLGLEGRSQLDELIGGSEVKTEDIADADLATRDVRILSHWKRLRSVASLPVLQPIPEKVNEAVRDYGPAIMPK